MPTEFDFEISEHFLKCGNSIIFNYDYKYENDEIFPSKTRRYVDVIHENGDKMFFRNGVQYKSINTKLPTIMDK